MSVLLDRRERGGIYFSVSHSQGRCWLARLLTIHLWLKARKSPASPTFPLCANAATYFLTCSNRLFFFIVWFSSCALLTTKYQIFIHLYCLVWFLKLFFEQFHDQVRVAQLQIIWIQEVRTMHLVLVELCNRKENRVEEKRKQVKIEL